jgi:hypothetical protein
LLERDLATQTSIAHTLEPETAEEEEAKKEESGQKKTEEKEAAKKTEEKSLATIQNAKSKIQNELPDEQTSELAEEQEHTGRRTDLLKLKAEAELKRMEQVPQPQASPAQPQPVPPAPQPGPAARQDGDKKLAQPGAPPSPDQIKDGLRKAVELAPKAVEKMNAAAGSLRSKKPDAAYPDAEEARKILDEIAKAQPKQENKDQKKDEDKKDQKKDEQKKDENKQDEKKDQQKEQMNADKIEAAFRQVREREKQKHEREKEMKAILLQGDRSVEKDW